MSGYYCMQRGWHDHPLFEGEPYSRRDAWEWLIANAYWQDKERRINGKMVLIKRSQVPHSIRFMAEKWGWHRSRVERFLECLKTETMIETDSETGQLIITICNYEEYQRNLMDSETAIEAGSETASRQHRDKEEESKEITPLNASLKGCSNTPPNGGDLKQQGKAKKSDLSRLLYADLPQKWGEWAHAAMGWDQETMADVWLEFRDHWQKQEGKKALKSNWISAWRNWCKRERFSVAAAQKPAAKPPEKPQVCSCGQHTGANGWSPQITAEKYAWYRSRHPGGYGSEQKAYLESYERVHGVVVFTPKTGVGR